MAVRKPALLTVGEQRRKIASKLMVSIGLQAHLKNLTREILSGNYSKIPEFQEFIRYAPEELRSKLLDDLDEMRKKLNLELENINGTNSTGST
jgi:hypothetical protein